MYLNSVLVYLSPAAIFRNVDPSPVGKGNAVATIREVFVHGHQRQRWNRFAEVEPVHWSFSR